MRQLAVNQRSLAMRTRTLVRAALTACALATLGARATIPERAWANGQAMSNSRAYRQATNGDMSLTTQNQLRAAANPRRLNHREVQFQPFTHWW
jgi:hypothetical protein